MVHLLGPPMLPTRSLLFSLSLHIMLQGHVGLIHHYRGREGCIQDHCNHSSQSVDFFFATLSFVLPKVGAKQRKRIPSLLIYILLKEEQAKESSYKLLKKKIEPEPNAFNTKKIKGLSTQSQTFPKSNLMKKTSKTKKPMEI